MSKLLVCNVAGLSPRLLKEPGSFAATRSALGRSSVTPLRPVFPALTCTAQATYTTGRLPGDHGIVANGCWDPQRRTVSMWEQAAGLIELPRIWEVAREKRPGTRTAYLFWWNGMHSSADLFVNVAPFHLADGRTVPACYTKPSDLHARLAERLGTFPLHRFWGPFTSIEATAWIAGATKQVMESDDLDLVFTYLPHLDCGLQKFGPASEAAARDLAELDEVAADLVRRARELGFKVIIISEYGVTQVSGAVGINRELRRRGWVEVREAAGMEFIDIGACRAFAMADHQVAHVYTRGVNIAEVAEFLASLDGVDRVLSGKRLREAGIAHPRTGNLVAIAGEDRWFSYYWWLDEEKAPDFAWTVDIHRKPGFDPLEMFLDPKAKRISQDSSLIKGSHGRLPAKSDDWAAAMADFDLPQEPIRAEKLFGLLLARLCR